MLISILAILWQSFLIVTQRYDLVKRAFGLLWWWWGHIHPRHRFSHRGRPSVFCSTMWWWWRTKKPPSILVFHICCQRGPRSWRISRPFHFAFQEKKAAEVAFSSSRNDGRSSSLEQPQKQPPKFRQSARATTILCTTLYYSSIQECRSSILERAFDIMLCPELLRSCAHILFQLIFSGR